MSDEIDEMEEKEGGKRQNGLLIIILVVMQFLTLGGLGAYIYLDRSSGGVVVSEPAELDDGGGVVVESTKVEEASKTKSSVILSKSPMYLQTPSIVANLNKPEQYSYISLKVSIRTFDQRIIDTLASSELKLRSIVQEEVRTMNEGELTGNTGVKGLTSRIKKRLSSFLRERELDPKYIDDLFLADLIME